MFILQTIFLQSFKKTNKIKIPFIQDRVFFWHLINKTIYMLNSKKFVAFQIHRMIYFSMIFFREITETSRNFHTKKIIENLTRLTCCSANQSANACLELGLGPRQFELCQHWPGLLRPCFRIWPFPLHLDIPQHTRSGKIFDI